MSAEGIIKHIVDKHYKLYSANINASIGYHLHYHKKYHKSKDMAFKLEPKHIHTGLDLLKDSEWSIR